MKKLHEYSLYIAEKQLRKVVGVCCSLQEFDSKIIKVINQGIADRQRQIRCEINRGIFNVLIQKMDPTQSVLEIKITPIRL